MITNKHSGRYYCFWVFAKENVWTDVSSMTVWYSKKVFLSRKVILSKNGSSGVLDVSRCWRSVFLSYAAFCACNVRGLEDISQCCKGLVLTLHWRNILVCLRMFATKTVVHVWILSSLIYDRWIRTKVWESKFTPSISIKLWKPREPNFPRGPRFLLSQTSSNQTKQIDENNNLNKTKREQKVSYSKFA